ALGNLVRFVLLPGHRFDTVGVAPLIQDLEFGALIADKAFDSNALIADLDARGAKVVISQRPRRASPRLIDLDIYKWRHLVSLLIGIGGRISGLLRRRRRGRCASNRGRLALPLAADLSLLRFPRSPFILLIVLLRVVNRV